MSDLQLPEDPEEASTSGVADPPPGFLSRRAYRLTVLALGVLGLAAAAAAVAVDDPELRPVLGILAAIGLYGTAVLYFVRPGVTGVDRPTEHVFEAHAATLAALREDLGLKKTGFYVPVDEHEEGFAPVRVFYPGRGTERLPRRADLDPVLDPASPRAGALAYPTGAALFRRYEAIATTDLATDVDDLAEQLAEATTGGLEIAGKAVVQVDRFAGRIVVDVREPRYGPPTKFDHPVTSFIATGLALGLDRPVGASAQKWGDVGYRIVCTYRPDESG